MPEIIKLEVIIIGGGLAGAAVAARLSKAGRDVLLFEKESVAHHKVCGEFISWETAHYLQSLGIDLLSLGAETVNHFMFHDGNRSVSTKLPFTAYSLSRRCLDQALLIKAQESGTDIRRGVAVTELQQNGREWMVSAGGQKYETKTVFLASGKHDLRHWKRPIGHNGDMIGFKMHLRLSDKQRDYLRNNVEMFLLDGGYSGLELVENNIANLCMVIRKSYFQKNGNNWSELIDNLLKLSPPLSERLDGSVFQWQKPLAVYNIPYGFVYNDREKLAGLFRIGDQMAVIPSFSGDGMAMAMHSAFLASSCYLRGDTAEEYHRMAQRDFRAPMIAASFINKVMHSLPSWIYAHPHALRWVAQKTRLNTANVNRILHPSNFGGTN